MKKSVLTAFITVVCATSSVMAADDNAITDGSVTFNGKVIAPACTLVATTKDSVVTLPDGNDSNLLIVFYVQIMPDDFVMQLHR
ncbi:hypothetical protein P2O75_17345, partial [Escherichia coli]